jgi:hypothetical protein
MHDPRIGRFFALDPLASLYPKWSPYCFSGNQVIHSNELEGLEPGEDLTPSGGSIKMPSEAKNIVRYHEDGYRQVIYGNAKNGEYYDYFAKDGSVKSFEYKGTTFIASYDLNSGDFIGYHDSEKFGSLGICSGIPDISFSNSKVYTTETNFNSEGSMQASFGVMTSMQVEGGLLTKNPAGLIATALMGAGACALSSINFTTYCWDFSLKETLSLPTSGAIEILESNPKKEAREKGKEIRDSQPASEDYAKWKAKSLEKRQGKEARRVAHDKKTKGSPNRTKKELDEDYE